MYKEIKGNLITLAIDGKFDVIAQGNNCFCTQGAGIAPQFVRAFGTDKFEKEGESYRGNIDKLGTIDWEIRIMSKGVVQYPKSVPRPKGKAVVIVNCYTQYGFGSNHEDGSTCPLDYEALILCMRKINHIFSGKKIGLPQIGAGLGGGDWTVIKPIIQYELKDCEPTVVIFDGMIPIELQTIKHTLI